jgi:hypothetical protein
MDGTFCDRQAARLWRAAAVASVLSALMLAAFLLARRISGDASAPLSAALLMPTATVLVAWAWLVRLALQNSIGVDRIRLFSGFKTHDAILWLWLPASVVLSFAVALSFPGARIIDWLVWLAALTAITLGPARVLRRAHRAQSQRRGDSNEMTVQDLKRYRSEDGRESVRGTLATQIVPAQRTATLFAAFCPPFEHLPQVHAHAAGRTASVKVAQVLHNGVQLEVRLASEAKTNQLVTVEFIATELRAAS